MTEALAKALVDLRYGDFSETTRLNARQFFLDWLACCIRGSAEPAAQMMRQVLDAEPAARGTATTFCRTPYRTSSLNAALSNGAASHALDMDDLHNASIIHLGTVVVPAAVAVAERIHANGQDLIEALVAGCEAAARVGEAVNPGSYFFWHTTGTAGTFGAAAAAAKLLKLDVPQTVACLGSAGTQAAGLWEFLIDGAMSKTLHAGKAAMNGIIAADLAQKGFTAAKRILEGDKGFCLAMWDKSNLDVLVEGLGKSLRIDTNGYKAYTCCRHTHSAINAALNLRSKHNIDPAKIAAIAIRTYKAGLDIVNNPAPVTDYGHKFSIQYCVAAALFFGRVSLDEFFPQSTGNPGVRRLMQAATAAVDPTIDREFIKDPMKWAAEVTVTMQDGKKYVETVTYPKGDPENPQTYAETEEKFRRVTAPVIDKSCGDKLLQIAAGLDGIPDLSQALAFLTPANAPAAGRAA